MTKEKFISICMKEIPCSYKKAESMWYKETKFSDILLGIIHPIIHIGEDKKGRYMTIHEEGHHRISTIFNL